MNYGVKIEQCNATIRALEMAMGILIKEVEIEKVKLIKERENANTPKWEHGDTAYCQGNKAAPRLFIQGSKGLMIFDVKTGFRFNFWGRTADQWAKMYGYIKTGNIFTSGD